MEELFHIIKLDAIGSTNEYLKNLSAKKSLKDFTVVVTENQQKGRGQMGKIWQSEQGKNLTFSLLKYFEEFHFKCYFDLNMAVSLAVRDTLYELDIPNISVKWPNDILSGNAKICGILIENVMQSGRINRSIIGIGLNVNQTKFMNLEKAGSLNSVTGMDYDLNDVLHRLLSKTYAALENLENQPRKKLLDRYQKFLFRRNSVSTFRNQNGELFNGIIHGVSEEGKLQIQLEDNSLKDFGFKEVQLLY